MSGCSGTGEEIQNNSIFVMNNGTYAFLYRVQRLWKWKFYLNYLTQKLCTENVRIKFFVIPDSFIVKLSFFTYYIPNFSLTIIFNSKFVFDCFNSLPCKNPFALIALRINR